MFLIIASVANDDTNSVAHTFIHIAYVYVRFVTNSQLLIIWVLIIQVLE
jgi:hypothetical protein